MPSKKRPEDIGTFLETFENGMPSKGTPSCRAFFETSLEIVSFKMMVLDAIIGFDKYAEGLKKVLEGAFKNDSEYLDEMKEYWENRVDPLEHLRKRKQFFFQVIIVKHMENYLNYLSSLLNEIFTQVPDTLKSKETMKVEDILSHSSLEELVESIAERKVESLSYSSFWKLREYFKNTFHIEICSQEATDTFVEYSELRNISVHNRCKVNERYLERTGSNNFSLGETRVIEATDVYTLTNILSESVRDIDVNARKKWALSDLDFEIEKLEREPFLEASRMGIWSEDGT